jgi:hypothetical protein
MKHLKKYNESAQEFGLIDIIYILQDYIDEGYNIVIFSATGHSFYPSDTDERSLSNFRLQRPFTDSFESKSKAFGFRIDFNKNKNYSELVSLLDEMNVSVGRFNDLGFYLKNVKIGQNEESNVYNSRSVGFSFES